MGAGGVIAGMIQSFNQNRQEIKSRRKVFNSEGPEKRALHLKEPIRDKIVSDSEMELIKRKIRWQRRKEVNKAIIIILITSLLVAAGVFWIMLS